MLGRSSRNFDTQIGCVLTKSVVHSEFPIIREVLQQQDQMAENHFGSNLLRGVLNFWTDGATTTHKTELIEATKNNGWRMRREVWDQLPFKGNLHSKLYPFIN